MPAEQAPPNAAGSAPVLSERRSGPYLCQTRFRFLRGAGRARVANPRMSGLLGGGCRGGGILLPLAHRASPAQCPRTGYPPHLLPAPELRSDRQGPANCHSSPFVLRFPRSGCSVIIQFAILPGVAKCCGPVFRECVAATRANAGVPPTMSPEMKLSRIETNWIASKLLSDAESARERSAARRTAWIATLIRCYI